MTSWSFERAERIIVKLVGLITLAAAAIKIILHELGSFW
jgi:hypothetical protein